MTKNVEFENKLSDLITETFDSKEELLEAIRYFGDVTLKSYLESTLEIYECALRRM